MKNRLRVDPVHFLKREDGLYWTGNGWSWRYWDAEIFDCEDASKRELLDLAAILRQTSGQEVAICNGLASGYRVVPILSPQTGRVKDRPEREKKFPKRKAKNRPKSKKKGG